MLRGPLRFRRSPLMPLVLERLTDDSPLTIDLGGIVPDRLADLAPDAIARLPIRVDGRPRELGSVFALRGAATDGRIECRGDFSRVQRVGMLMARGEIVVHGHVGRHAGERMTGGRLTVHGDAGDWLAAEMAGGTVQVAGNGGDNVAASLPGSVTGVRGGLVLVGGDVGCLAGARMQRGLLAIGGRCGAGLLHGDQQVRVEVADGRVLHVIGAQRLHISDRHTGAQGYSGHDDGESRGQR